VGNPTTHEMNHGTRHNPTYGWTYTPKTHTLLNKQKLSSTDINGLRQTKTSLIKLFLAQEQIYVLRTYC